MLLHSVQSKKQRCGSWKCSVADNGLDSICPFGNNSRGTPPGPPGNGTSVKALQLGQSSLSPYNPEVWIPLIPSHVHPMSIPFIPSHPMSDSAPTLSISVPSEKATAFQPLPSPAGTQRLVSPRHPCLQGGIEPSLDNMPLIRPARITATYVPTTMCCVSSPSCSWVNSLRCIVSRLASPTSILLLLLVHLPAPPSRKVDIPECPLFAHGRTRATRATRATAPTYCYYIGLRAFGH